MAQLIRKRNCVGYSLRSQTDFSLPQVKSVNYGLKALRYFGPKMWNILPSDPIHPHGIFAKERGEGFVSTQEKKILKTLEHFENSQKKLTHGFLETVLVESVKITHIE